MERKLYKEKSARDLFRLVHNVQTGGIAAMSMASDHNCHNKIARFFIEVEKRGEPIDKLFLDYIGITDWDRGRASEWVKDTMYHYGAVGQLKIKYGLIPICPDMEMKYRFGSETGTYKAPGALIRRLYDTEDPLRVPAKLKEVLKQILMPASSACHAIDTIEHRAEFSLLNALSIVEEIQPGNMAIQRPDIAVAIKRGRTIFSSEKQYTKFIYELYMVASAGRR